jgi:hypothetical protein
MAEAQGQFVNTKKGERQLLENAARELVKTHLIEKT